MMVVRLAESVPCHRTMAQTDLTSVWVAVVSTIHPEVETAAIFQRSEGIMISRSVIRGSLQTMAPVMFLLLCSSISGFAQSPSKQQELVRIVFKNSTVKTAVTFVGKQLGL